MGIKKEHRLAAFKKLSRILEETAEESELLPQAFSVLEEMTGCQAGALALMGDFRGTLPTPYLHGIALDEFGTSELLPTGRKAEEAQPIILNDYPEHEAALPSLARAGVKGLLACPVRSAECFAGLLFLFDLTGETALSQEDAEAVMTASKMLFLALENRRLFRGEQDAFRRIEVFQRITLRLTGTLELQQVLNFILEAALELARWDIAHIFLYSDRGLSFGAALGPEGRMERPIIEPRRNGLTSRVAREGRPEVITDLSSHPLFVDRLPEMPGSLASLPLKIGHRVVGVMNIYRRKPGPFLESELQLWELLASQAAIAIENARLYQAEQSQHRAAEALRRAALALTSTVSLQDVFDRILSELRNVVPYDSASVQLLKGDRLEIIGGHGFPNLGELIGISFPASSDNPNSLVMKSRKPVIIDDVQLRYAAFSRDPHAASNIHGWLGAPLLIGDRLIGMLSLDRHQPCFYTEEHARIVESYAAQAAIAIENARLHQDLKEQLRALKESQSRLVVSEKLAAIGKLAAGVAHELNNPLTSIIGTAELLRLEETNEGIRQELSNLIEEAQRTAGIVRSLLDFARERAPERRPMQINELLANTLKLMAYDLRTQSIRVHSQLADDLPLTMADSRQIQQVFVNLINNARQALEDEPGGGNLWVSSERRAGSSGSGEIIRVLIRDDGSGIPPEMQSKIFDPFFTTRSLGNGMGLGLSASHGIIREHGGDIRVESTPGEGSTFIIELPVVIPEDTTWFGTQGAGC